MKSLFYVSPGIADGGLEKRCEMPIEQVACLSCSRYGLPLFLFLSLRSFDWSRFVMFAVVIS